jgi:hypothetical protein
MKNRVCFYVQFETENVAREEKKAEKKVYGKISGKMTRFPSSAYTCRQFVNIKPHENENEIRMSDTQQAAQGLVHNPFLLPHSHTLPHVSFSRF